ncbi:MAG TPA: SIS domain-containing protein [Patescibacteria group bacterium]|nr:SIS domain-containing protein [Patescibacteria group bacterium]
MGHDQPVRGRSAFVTIVVDRLAALDAHMAGQLDRAAELIWLALRRQRLVHVAGAGHSTLFALEAFYRAGGLAAVNPIWHPALLPLAGARMSTFAERISGLGSELVRSAAVAEGDVVVVFSHSGVNPVPVEIAETARALGASVIAVLSLEHCHSVPSRHAAGTRLADVVDVIIDTGGPIGDAGYRTRPGAPAVAPLSTLLGAYVWGAILVRLADRAETAGEDLPVWTSANIPDGDAQATPHVARFAMRIPAL